MEGNTKIARVVGPKFQSRLPGAVTFEVWHEGVEILFTDQETLALTKKQV
jgi:hypothetical protein